MSAPKAMEEMTTTNQAMMYIINMNWETMEVYSNMGIFIKASHDILIIIEAKCNLFCKDKKVYIEKPPIIVHITPNTTSDLMNKYIAPIKLTASVNTNDTLTISKENLLKLIKK